MPSEPRPGRALTVGLGLFTGQNPAGGAPLYHQAVELAVAAEASGFDTFWVSEHHGLADGYLPSPLTLLAAVAARTTSIELASGLATAPLYHPVRLAEDAAVVDQLSGGRLLLGLGLGYSQHEYDTFGVDEAGRGARLADLVRFLRQAWTGRELDWDGACLQARSVRVTPRPARAGGVPVWLGGYAPAAVRRAGRLADGYLVGRGDPELVSGASALLEQERAPSDPGFTMAVNLLVALRGDPADDRAVREGFAHQQGVYERIQRGRQVFAGQVAEPVAEPGPADLERYFHAVGDADEVVDAVTAALRPLRHWSRLHVVVRALVPQLEVRAQVRRTERLGAEVLPRLRSALGAD